MGKYVGRPDVEFDTSKISNLIPNKHVNRRTNTPEGQNLVALAGQSTHPKVGGAKLVTHHLCKVSKDKIMQSRQKRHLN